MGMCGDHNLRLKFKNEEAEKEAVNIAAEKIRQMEADGEAVFHIGERAKEGVTPDTLEGVIKMLLACQQSDIHEYSWRGYKCYENCFDSSYGWFDAICEVFGAMAPFLKEGSKYSCDESGTVEIKDGKLYSPPYYD